MEKNMFVNFDYLDKRVLDSLSNSDLARINYELKKINTPTIVSGVGGSSVVSTFTSRVLNKKNKIISTSNEPRDFRYLDTSGYTNVISCSYSGNNYGVSLAFANSLKHYLLSKNEMEGVTNLTYKPTIEKERSFISLGATLVPISIILNYYLEQNKELITELIHPYDFAFSVDSVYEIFTGIDTSTTSKYLESTMVESGIGVPIIHDKYSFCHGRSTTCLSPNHIAIYLNRNTDLDKILLSELRKYFKDIVVIESRFADDVLDDYNMLIQAMYLTKFIAEQKEVELSKINYNPVTDKIYKFSGSL